MIALILAFITRWKIVLIVSGAILIFLAGMRLEMLIYHSTEVATLQAQIKSLKDTTSAQSEVGRVITARNAALIETNQKLQTQIDQTYDKSPPIINPCMSPIRLRLINQQRAASNKRAGAI